MRCLLIIPSWIPEEIFPSRTAWLQLNYWQPLGTLYVASSLMRAGHEVSFLNGALITHQQVLDRVKALKPHWVGIYATTFGWPKACQTALDIKSLSRDIFVCAGGPYPIAMQEHCLSECQGFDAVVTGEGEHTVVELLERRSQGRSLEALEGIAFRLGQEIFKNPPRQLISDLDSLAFPSRELLGDANLYLPPPAMYRRKPVAVVLTSRGCNRNCIFCFQMDKHRDTGIRYRSVENVLSEIQLCLKQGFKEIKFIDDTFAQDRERAMHLAREIKARRMDFTWFASACVNQVDRELLRAFKEAGCWAILFGVESGVQKNLNTLRKGITLAQARQAVGWAKEAGLKVQTSFMIGIPGETYEEALQTIQFACDLDPDMASFHAIVPFPGTHLYDHAGEYGSISTKLTDFTYQGAAFVPYTMTRGQISELRQRAYRIFYSRPRFLVRRLGGLRKLEDLRLALRSAQGLFWLWVKKELLDMSGVR